MCATERRSGVLCISTVVTIRFVGGTVELRGLGAEAALAPGCHWDERSACQRAPASAYADIVRAFTRANICRDQRL